MNMFRQGDVMIVRDDNAEIGDSVPQDNGRVVLAYGEVTGHAHAISGSDTMLFERRQDPTPNNRVLKVVRPTSLRHEEHSPIRLDVGIYRIIRQREYEEGEIRNVAD